MQAAAAAAETGYSVANAKQERADGLRSVAPAVPTPSQSTAAIARAVAVEARKRWTFARFGVLR